VPKIVVEERDHPYSIFNFLYANLWANKGPAQVLAAG
jgi:hypothetical protein